MEKTFKTKTEGDVILDWDGSDMTVWTTGELRESIGEFSFSCYSGAEDEEYARVTGMHLEGPLGSKRFLRQGIGRAILEYVAEEEGWVIVFSNPDGIRRDDGSHLTEWGPAFAAAMVADGLACYG